MKELRLAGIAGVEAANACLIQRRLSARLQRALRRRGGGGTWVGFHAPFPASTSTRSCACRETYKVINDNCVSYRTLKLQIPESPMRAHFVRARVKVHVYSDGSHALFHGPRCIGRYDAKGGLKDAKSAA